MKFTINHRYSGAVLFEATLDTRWSRAGSAMQLGASILLAIEAGANLSEANLSGAYLCRANLSEANLSEANLSEANLSGADLSGADLSEVNLSEVNLSEANLSGADLSGADLSGADLYRADLSGADLSEASLSEANLPGADLSEANLSGANLYRADLSGADLSGADLYRADLSGARNADATIARTVVAPPEGEIIGWKKCCDGILIKVRVPPEARRSNASGRKCRAEYVEVVEVVGAEVGVSSHDRATTYRAGEIVRCDSWCEDRWHECSNGIHFFITRAEAESYR